jgi:hypothetical protein
MNEASGLRELSEKLETLIRLNAVALAEGRKRRDQIRLLSAGGLPPKMIAELVGTTPNTVSVELFALRREPGGTGARARKAADERT